MHAPCPSQWVTMVLLSLRDTLATPDDQAVRVPTTHRARGALRRRGAQPHPDGPRGAGAPGRLGPVELAARRMAGPPEDRPDRPRGDECDRRPGDADAGTAARRAVAAQWALQDRRAVQAGGPQGRRDGA